MKTDEEKLEDLLKAGAFHLLTPAEKEFVLRIVGSEKQFQSMQELDGHLSRLPGSEAPAPSSSILPALKQTMRRRSARKMMTPSIFQIKVPAYAVALLLLIVAVLTRVLSNGPSKVEVAGVPILRVDTIYKTKIDTVFQDRVITRYVPVLAPQKTELVAASSKQELSRGVSMKEKEELDNLLVSGPN